MCYNLEQNIYISGKMNLFLKITYAILLFYYIRGKPFNLEVQKQPYERGVLEKKVLLETAVL